MKLNRLDLAFMYNHVGKWMKTRKRYVMAVFSHTG